jgi:dUTP pyrophosphatase
MQLNIKKIYGDANVPKYGSEYAAGLDLYSYVDYDILPRTRQLISTGISLSWEGDEARNYYLRVAPRSGLSVKNNIDVGAGVIDYDYRGEIFVCLINNDNTKTFYVKKNDRIAQLVPTRTCVFSEIKEVDVLSDTMRGAGGFGSTG